MGKLTPAELQAYIKLLEDLLDAVGCLSCADEMEPTFSDLLAFKTAHNMGRLT